MANLRVLYEDNHLLVVDKVAGIATMGTEEHVPTVARQVAQYLKTKYRKPGNVFVGVVSRLDRLVSGVLVFARTSKAASRLSQQIRARQTQKRYLTWVEGSVSAGAKTAAPTSWREITHAVRKNERLKRMQIVAADRPGAQLATLRLRSLVQSGDSSLVEIELVTGRKHQIRLQLSELGHPIIGDRKYGAERSFARGIALHCHHLRLSHPTRKESLDFHSSPRAHWTRLPRALEDYLAAHL